MEIKSILIFLGLESPILFIANLYQGSWGFIAAILFWQAFLLALSIVIKSYAESIIIDFKD